MIFCHLDRAEFLAKSVPGAPPGPLLIELFRELLNVESDKHGATRHVGAQEQVAFVIAQDPTVHTRELARMVNVNPSTIFRWQRSSEFKESVERAARSIDR
jgi:hypothetical protein